MPVNTAQAISEKLMRIRFHLQLLTGMMPVLKDKQKAGCDSDSNVTVKVMVGAMRLRIIYATKYHSNNIKRKTYEKHRMR